MNVVQFSHVYELETRVAMPIMRLLCIDLYVLFMNVWPNGLATSNFEVAKRVTFMINYVGDQYNRLFARETELYDVSEGSS